MKSFRIKPNDPTHLALAVPVVAALALGFKQLYEMAVKRWKGTSKIAGEEYSFEDTVSGDADTE